MSQCRVIGTPAIFVSSFASDFSPGGEIQRARERRGEHHELRERDAGRLRERCRGVERRGTITRQPEDERPENVDAILAEGPQPLDELVAVRVERFVDVLQPFGCHRLDADERALDPGAAHRTEEFQILGRLHGDLGEKNHVLGQFRQPLHQLEPLIANRGEVVEGRRVRTPGRHLQIGPAARDRSCRRRAR